MHLLKKRLEKWVHSQIVADDTDRMLELTEKNLLAIIGEDHADFNEFKQILSLFRDLDYHPFELGAYDEVDKWNDAKQKMVELLQRVIRERKEK